MRQIVQEITHENLDFALTYRPPQSDEEKARYAKVNEAAKAAIRAILAAVPRCPQRTTAINKIVEARFWCNAAINYDVSLNPKEPADVQQPQQENS